MEQLIERLHLVDDERIYVVAEALRKGISVEKSTILQKLIHSLLKKSKTLLLWKKHWLSKV